MRFRLVTAAAGGFIVPPLLRPPCWPRGLAQPRAARARRRATPRSASSSGARRSAASRSRWRAPASGWIITSTGRTGAPIDFTITRFEMKYTPDWQPLEMKLEAGCKNAPVDRRDVVRA